MTARTSLVFIALPTGLSADHFRLPRRRPRGGSAWSLPPVRSALQNGVARRI